MAVGLFEGPSHPEHFSHTNYFFTMLSFERPRKGSAQPLKSIYCFLFSSCFSLARLFILILLLMSGNFYPNPDPIFFFSVCAGNMTWRGRSMQCCTCPKWVYLKCSLLSCYRFKTLSKLTPGATLLAAICMYTFSMSTSTV